MLVNLDKAFFKTGMPLGRASCVDWSNGTGHVWAQGERWDAIGPPLLREGTNVRVSGLRGLTLEIQRTEPDDVKTGEPS